MTQRLLATLMVAVTICAATIGHTASSMYLDQGTSSGAMSQSLSPVAAAVRPQSSYGDVPVSFEPNYGQQSIDGDYFARAHGYILGLKPDRATLVLQSPTIEHQPDFSPPPSSTQVTMRFVGADADATTTAEVPLPGMVNYFHGSDAAQWLTEI